MSIRPCARPSNAERPGFVSRVLLLLCLSVSSLLNSSAQADETIIVSLTLNQERKGEVFVVLRDDGDFLVPAGDLEQAGLRQLPSARISVDGTDYVALSSLKGIDARFNEATLTLELSAAPELLPTSIRDLSPPRREEVIQPRDHSVFFNYGFDYSAGDGFSYEDFAVSNELGIRHRDLLFLTDTLFRTAPDDSRFNRLNTSLIWDDRHSLQRGTAGDLLASSGTFGSRVQLGGVGLSKIYRIDPYFTSHPLFDFSGTAALPSDVDIYVNGTRFRSEHLPPGAFELRNLQGLIGAQEIEIVIRDALGREQRIAVPYYFSDQLLRRGLHEYSYNLGLLRYDYGQEDDRYADPAFLAFHRYGFSDTVNLEARGESGAGIFNLGFGSTLTVGNAGLLNLAGGISLDGGKAGGAGFIGYEYNNRTLRGRLALQGFSEDYRTLAEAKSSSWKEFNVLVGVGYVTPKLGSLGLDYSKSTSYREPDRDILAFSWSGRFWKQTYINATFRQTRGEETAQEFGINLTWYLDRDHSISSAVRHEEGADTQFVETRKTTPAGEGTGWTGRLEHGSGAGEQSYLLNGMAQHNARAAVIRGDLSLGHNTNDALRLSLAGSVVHLGHSVHLSRPVNDSFALVSVGGVEGIGVYVNGQALGRTDHGGQLLIPQLSSYYENQISIEDQDIPMEFLMPRVRLNISPPLRSGSCINFPLQKYQAYTGSLLMDDGRDKKPLAYAELTLAAPTGDVTFWTGRDGEFYLDSQQQETFDLSAFQGCEAPQSPAGSFLPAGSHPVTVKQETRTFQTQMTIPPALETFVDLGEVVWPAPAAQPGPLTAPELR